MAITLPPWLTPSDPAPAVLRGFTVGADVGFKQAAQRFQQLQAARQEQLDAQEQARWETQMGLQAAELARKHQAQMQYRSAIEGGMDPLDAMIRFGPEMGQQGSAEAAAIRAMQQRDKGIPAWKKVDFDGASVLMSDDGRVVNLPKPSAPTAQWTTETRTDEEGNEYQVQVDKSTGSVKSYPGARQQNFWQQSWADRDELRALETDLNQLERNILDKEDSPIFLNAMKKTPEKRSAMEVQIISLIDGWKARAQSLSEQIKDLRNRYRPKSQQGQPQTQQTPSTGIRILNIRPVTPTK